MKKATVITATLCTSIFLTMCGQQKSGSEASHDDKTAMHHEQVVISTPDDAIAELKAGNKRFLEIKLINTNYKEEIEHTKDTQHPHSIILSCIDSRVPPEILFDQGIGNIFVTRIAGNVEDANVLGGMEYAVKEKGTKLIVVMGHNKCGAVTGAIENAKLGNLTQLVDQIKPAIKGDTSNVDLMIDETSKNNVRMTIADILKGSPVISDLVKEGKVKITGAAYYDITSGQVNFME